MEDEMSGRGGPVIKACRECAGPEVVSSSRMCASRELVQLQKGHEFGERYTCANKLFDNKVTTAMIKSLGQVNFLK